MNTIDEALDYLYGFINYETDTRYSYTMVHYNVGRTLRLLDALSNPQDHMKIIHVAGTKGKGSVCCMLASLLLAHGLSTGLYISPHISRVNERISVDDADISDREFIDLINRVRPHVDAFPADDPPTTFEILTAMGMLHFRDTGVSYAVLETGMGGRFDSTNFCDPEISVITSVSYDHMDKLGERIEQIAFEKAGIIKARKPVVVGYQVYDVRGIFEKKAGELSSRLYAVQDLCSYEIANMTERGTRFSATIDDRTLSELFVSLPGKHQVENAVAALLTLKVLGLLPPEAEVRDVLGRLCFPTRMELIERKRRFLLDSAHNGDSARALAEAVQAAFRKDRLITVVGIVKGKDVEGIMKHLAPISSELIVTEPLTHKELDTDLVFKTALTLHPRTLLIPDIREALDYAEQRAGREDLIVVTGSFYTTSPARSILLTRAGETASL